jgi:cellulose synthase operon protein C
LPCLIGQTGFSKAYSSNAEHHSKEGLGAQFERAKHLLTQVPGIENEAQRASSIRQATDDLGAVVRSSSPFKSEALELLKKYKPKTAANLSDIAKLNFEDAMSQADQAIAGHEWDRAITLLKQAVRRAEAIKNIDKTNLARYNMAFCFYMNKQYYEALVLTERLTRRYPQGSLSANATEIGMAALADAYNTYREIDRASDLNHLIELATYTVETWPDSEQGDGARMVLG